MTMVQSARAVVTARRPIVAGNYRRLICPRKSEFTDLLLLLLLFRQRIQVKDPRARLNTFFFGRRGHLYHYYHITATRTPSPSVIVEESPYIIISL